MPVKKHSVEEIIAKLREIEKLTAQSMSVAMAARKVGVAGQTLYRWRIRYIALKPAVPRASRSRTRRSYAPVNARAAAHRRWGTAPSGRSCAR